MPNLLHHVNTIRNTFHLPCVVAINAFPTDTAAELRLVEDKCRALGVNAVLSEVWAKGGEGGRALAQEVVRLCDQPQLAPFSFAYPDNASLAYKLNAIVGRVYGGAQAVLTPAAQKQLQRLTELGFGELPVCMAKTQYSLSDDPTLLGAPTGFTVTVRSLRVSAGAGFIVAYTGDIMTMPGLPRSRRQKRSTWTKTASSPACSDEKPSCPMAGRFFPSVISPTVISPITRFPRYTGPHTRRWHWRGTGSGSRRCRLR